MRTNKLGIVTLPIAETPRRRFVSLSCALLGTLASILGCGGEPGGNTEPTGELEQSWVRARPELRALGVFKGDGGVGAAEIPAFDPGTARLFIVNVTMQRIDVVDVENPSEPTPVGAIDVTPYGKQANSVAVSPEGVVAASVVAENPQEPGTLAFFDTDGAPIASVAVGAGPDMVVFTPDGDYALVANEGEPSDDYAIDPEGSISIVDLRGGVENLTQAEVRTADFRAFDTSPLDPSVRIFGPGATPSQDFEPEYITVSDDSRTAWVTLQENNALARVDVQSSTVQAVTGLGFKDHSQPGYGLDASDKDDAIAIANYPVFGMYMPDGIDAFRTRGRTYVITANEGDAREYGALEEEVRCKDLTLDPTAFPNAAELQADERMGRLALTSVNGDVDGDGDYDELYSFGARSFAIWDREGQLVYESGDDLEEITAAAYPDAFNSNDDENDSFDSRSDAKGPEPESVVVGRVRGRSYAFIGLERIGGIVVYDVSVPSRPSFLQYLNTRDFTVDLGEEGADAGDLAPEGLVFIPARKSPTGTALLAASYEVSGTTRIFEFD